MSDETAPDVGFHLPYIVAWCDGGGGLTWACPCGAGHDRDPDDPRNYARYAEDEAKQRAVDHVVTMHPRLAPVGPLTDSHWRDTALGGTSETALVAALRKHHRKRPDDKSHADYCAQCYWPWPCPNVRAADLLAAPPSPSVPGRGGMSAVTIYRAVPAPVTDFRPGDFVALDFGYCAMHADGMAFERGEAWHVIERQVPAAEVVWAGPDLDEWFRSEGERREFLWRPSVPGSTEEAGR